MLFQFLVMADYTRLGLGWKWTLVVIYWGSKCSAIPQVAYRWLCGDRLKWMSTSIPQDPQLAPGEPLAEGRGWCSNKSGGNEPWGRRVKARRSWKPTNLIPRGTSERQGLELKLALMGLGEESLSRNNSRDR